MAAVAQDNAGTEDGLRRIRQQHPRHVLAEFLGTRIRIVIRSVPIDRLVFRYKLVAPLPCNRHRADFAETSQSMVVLSVPCQRQNFQRAAQIDVQATLFRFSIEGSSTVNYGIRGVYQAVVLISSEAETRVSQISEKIRTLVCRYS